MAAALAALSKAGAERQLSNRDKTGEGDRGGRLVAAVPADLAAQGADLAAHPTALATRMSPTSSPGDGHNGTGGRRTLQGGGGSSSARGGSSARAVGFAASPASTGGGGLEDGGTSSSGRRRHALTALSGAKAGMGAMMDRK